MVFRKLYAGALIFWVGLCPMVYSTPPRAAEQRSRITYLEREILSLRREIHKLDRRETSSTSKSHETENVKRRIRALEENLSATDQLIASLVRLRSSTSLKQADPTACAQFLELYVEHAKALLRAIKQQDTSTVRRIVREVTQQSLGSGFPLIRLLQHPDLNLIDRYRSDGTIVPVPDFRQPSIPTDQLIDILQYAAYIGNPEIVQVLLDEGVNPRVHNGAVIEYPSLLVALRYGHEEIVDKLLSNLPEVSQADYLEKIPGCRSMIRRHLGIGATVVISASKQQIGIETLVLKLYAGPLRSLARTAVLCLPSDPRIRPDYVICSYDKDATVLEPVGSATYVLAEPGLYKIQFHRHDASEAVTVLGRPDGGSLVTYEDGHTVLISSDGHKEVVEIGDRPEWPDLTWDAKAKDIREIYLAGEPQLRSLAGRFQRISLLCCLQEE